MRHTWHDVQVAPFDEAEFYAHGSVVTVTLGNHSVTVDSEGKRCWEHEDGRMLRKPQDFRLAFPDGVIPGDGEEGWAIINNGWFDLYGADGDHLEVVCYSLKEAIAEAEALVMGYHEVDRLS